MLGVSSAWAMSVFGRGTPLPLDCPPRLVVRGPYRFVRNPMAIAGLGQGAAVGVWLGSFSVEGYVLVGFIVWNWFVRPIEEADLRARFGGSYENYCRHVICWRPRVRGLSDEQINALPVVNGKEKDGR